MELDYKEMDVTELKKLYQNLCEIDRNVTYDYKDRKKELNKLQEEKLELLNIKRQIEYLNSSNEIKLNKSMITSFSGLSAAALGYCIYLAKDFTNQPEKVIALAISALTLYCTGMVDYAFLSNYLYDKRLLKNNDLSELNAKIDNINAKIKDTSNNLATDEKILKKCRRNLPLLKDTLIKAPNKKS